MKKLIAFDLDDTLAVSKSPISDRMAGLLVRLLDRFEVCVISGGKIELFHRQVVGRLEASSEQLARLHLMPTCGTRYYRYDTGQSEWLLQYAEDLTPEQKETIIQVLKEEEANFDLKNKKTWGPIIEDRQSQIAYSILGQEAPPEEKYKWSEAYADIKKTFRDRLAERLPDLEVRLGGATTIDITRLGIDKAYGMHKLMAELDISKEDILFLGDKLEEGGNDYPVKAMGIDCLEVSRWQDTALVLEGILHVL